MNKKLKFKRNAPCPCRSGKKYKKCCEGKVDWDHIANDAPHKAMRHLSICGKNLIFLSLCANILGFDPSERKISWPTVKKAITPQVVQAIHLAVMTVWPDEDDLMRVLREEADDMSGLYVGTYDLDAVRKGVTRHCLYSDSILLVDPFTYARHINDEYNPLIKPEQYITDTLKCLRLWFGFAPWISAGIVRFIRTRDDFDLKLKWECIGIQEERCKQHPELGAALEAEAKGRLQAMEERMVGESMLRLPDDYMADVLRQTCTEQEVQDFLKHMKKKREADPYYAGPADGHMRHSELTRETTGANYEMAKRTALTTGSYLITDLAYRWKEIEIDRKGSHIDDGNWTPFAKAFHGTQLKCLDNVPLERALELRENGCLEKMRGFMRRVWSVAERNDPYTKENIETLTAELQHHISEAEAEWKQIDLNLVKWVTVELAGGGGTAVALGKPGWMPAVVLAATGQLIHAGMKRLSFKKRFPAGFFIDCR